eukprot:m.181872 g.181872  ORF g.181872 m.181872 type:complete len:856 (-) comp16635_c0_seq5:1970-4537(-)
MQGEADMDLSEAQRLVDALPIDEDDNAIKSSPAAQALAKRLPIHLSADIVLASACKEAATRCAIGSILQLALKQNWQWTLPTNPAELNRLLDALELLLTDEAQQVVNKGVEVLEAIVKMLAANCRPVITKWTMSQLSKFPEKQSTIQYTLLLSPCFRSQEIGPHLLKNERPATIEKLRQRYEKFYNDSGNGLFSRLLVLAWYCLFFGVNDFAATAYEALQPDDFNLDASWSSSSLENTQLVVLLNLRALVLYDKTSEAQLLLWVDIALRALSVPTAAIMTEICVLAKRLSEVNAELAAVVLERFGGRLLEFCMLKPEDESTMYQGQTGLGEVPRDFAAREAFIERQRQVHRLTPFEVAAIPPVPDTLRSKTAYLVDDLCSTSATATRYLFPLLKEAFSHCESNEGREAVLLLLSAIQNEYCFEYFSDFLEILAYPNFHETVPLLAMSCFFRMNILLTFQQSLDMEQLADYVKEIMLCCLDDSKHVVAQAYSALATLCDECFIAIDPFVNELCRLASTSILLPQFQDLHRLIGSSLADVITASPIVPDEMDAITSALLLTLTKIPAEDLATRVAMLEFISTAIPHLQDPIPANVRQFLLQLRAYTIDALEELIASPHVDYMEDFACIHLEIYDGIVDAKQLDLISLCEEGIITALLWVANHQEHIFKLQARQVSLLLTIFSLLGEAVQFYNMTDAIRSTCEFAVAFLQREETTTSTAGVSNALWALYLAILTGFKVSIAALPSIYQKCKHILHNPSGVSKESVGNALLFVMTSSGHHLELFDEVFGESTQVLCDACQRLNSSELHDLRQMVEGFRLPKTLQQVMLQAIDTRIPIVGDYERYLADEGDSDDMEFLPP